MFFLLYNLVYFACLEKYYDRVSDCLCITVKNVGAQCHISTLIICLNAPLSDPVLVNLRLCWQWDRKSFPVLSTIYISVCRFLSTSLALALIFVWLLSMSNQHSDRWGFSYLIFGLAAVRYDAAFWMICIQVRGKICL